MAFRKEDEQWRLTHNPLRPIGITSFLGRLQTEGGLEAVRFGFLPNYYSVFKLGGKFMETLRQWSVRFAFICAAVSVMLGCGAMVFGGLFVVFGGFHVVIRGVF